MTEELP